METNEQISRQLIYYLERNSDLSETGFKVMKSHENIGFLPCNYVFYNGKIKLIYNKGELLSLNEIISQITPDKYLEIVTNLFNLLIEIRDIGFLQYRNIIVSLDRIYVDINNYKVSIIYLPLNIMQDIDFRELERNLIELLLEIGENYKNICSQKYSRFCELLRGNNTIEVIKQEIKNAETEKEVIQQYIPNEDNQPKAYKEKERIRLFGRHKKEKAKIQTEFKVRVEGGATEILENLFIPQIKLRYLGGNGNLEIIISKEEFLIGKQEGSVDFALSISNAISRIHCKIVTVNDIAYIEDLKSSNGTSVNGRRLSQSERMVLKHGDKIMIANQEFAVIKI